ncbi:unnamed protein product [Anisakis simplex]|uniref:LP15633p (inferred by orthology to a D. melanogaster protein) n=1 Tax=Anisakis simplex TaxID=6269 RepID=A0A0M3J153_ANISI|nr:unnamed protein product [Anisakis simplex]
MCTLFQFIFRQINADESRIQESEYKFAIELLRYVTRNGHTSFVISPFSIAITLSILSYGAVGNTQAQIDKLIANGIEHQRTQNYFKTHNDQLQNSSSNSTISNTAFHSLNLIVIRQKNNLTSINEQFRLNTVHEYYRSQIMLNDFSNATDLISVRSTCSHYKVYRTLLQRVIFKDIDEWIRAESDSYIDTIANQANTRPQSKILVFNAVWMWAEWIKKFKNEETFLKDFYVNQDEIKRVNMMPIWAYGTYRYGENADLQVVGIPFSDEETYMYIFLTRDRYAVLNDFIKDMDYQRIIALINRCKIVDVEVGHCLT